MRSPRSVSAASVVFVALAAATSCVPPKHARRSTRAPSAAVVPPKPTLPESASPLLAAIEDAAWARIAVAPASGLLIATSRNRFDPDVLLTSREVFPAYADEIAGAQSEILLQTYKLEPRSDPAREIFRGLARLQQRLRESGGGPVRVRILVDVWDVRSPAFRLLPQISASLAALEIDRRLIDMQLAVHRHAGRRSHHSKSLVVDGNTAIVTGSNADRKHDYGAPWFDQGFRMEGEIAGALRQEFADAWRSARAWRCGTDSSHGHCLTRAQPLADPADLPSIDDGAAEVPALMVTRTAGGKAGSDPVEAAFLAAFANARATIRVETPNLNARDAVDALLDAARRGVTIELVLSKNFHRVGEGLPGEGGSNEEVLARMYERLSNDGVADPCSTLRARWYSPDGTRPVSGTGAGANHAKYVSVDGRVVIVGSSNLDNQSWRHSREVNVVVDGAATTRAWDAQAFVPAFERSIPVEQCRPGVGAAPGSTSPPG